MLPVQPSEAVIPHMTMPSHTVCRFMCMDGMMTEVLSDPRVRRVLLHIIGMGHATAGELCEADPSIPRSTMYRLLAKMEGSGMIEVARREQKRGTTEKTYALSPGAIPSFQQIRMFPMFCMRFEDMFRRHAGMDPGEARKAYPIGFQALQVCGSDREIGMLVDGILGLVRSFGSEAPEEERRRCTLGIIVSPPTEDR